MDVEYFGPNPIVQSLVPGGVGAGSEMAEALGDADFAKTCKEIFATGAPATEATLFNGQYYEQKVVPPGDFAKVAPHLRHSNMGAERADHPEFQIEDGCITDQLLGDTYARLVGLGPVFDPGHVAAALTASIV